MNGEIKSILLQLPGGIGYIVLSIIVLIVARIIKDYLTPYKIHEQMTGKDNPALGLSMTGYYIAVLIVFLGAMIGGEDAGITESASAFGMDLLEIFLYSLGGIFLLNLARFILDKLVLNQFSTKKEIIEDRNVGMGAVEFGSYIASGLIIAGAINGEGGGPLSAIVFFLLGQLVLLGYSKIYQLSTPYDIHEEIEKDNVAAGVAFGGNMVAIGIILLKGVQGDFIGWGSNIAIFAVYAAIGFGILFLLRAAVDYFILPQASVSHEIAVDRNINAAYIETAVLAGVSAIIYFAW